jgi:Ca2+-binding EF-hand superfamily protein
MRPASIDVNPRDGTVTFNELLTYLQEAQNFAPLGAQAGPPADPRSEAMFQQLDRDGDKVVTPAELSETDRLIARLDSDEDETISLDELTPDRSPLADRFRGAIRGSSLLETATSPAVPITSAADRASIATRLISAWGKGPPAGLGREPLGADWADFQAADANQDGRLDHDEIARYLQAPTVHLELAVNLATAPQGQGRIEKVAGRPNPPPTRAGAGTLVVDVAGSEVEFSAAETRNNLNQFFENQFKNADANKDGAISAQEANGILQQVHAVADRNSDGRMTEAELRTYLELTNAAEEARAVATVSDQGIALYERLDGNRDGRLSIRELRGAPAKLAGLDTDHDGKLAFSEIPRRTQLNLGRGPLGIRNRVVVASAALNTPVRPLAGASSLPAWFAGMDRNRDGDVSAREFLGPPDQFRRFDADGDGLIDASEAARP